MLNLYLEDLRYKQKVFNEDGASSSMLKILLADGSGANFWYRLMQVCSKRSLTMPFALLFQYINKLLNHCVIGIKADFGPGFVLMHPTGVVINSKVTGGTGVVLESGVVIGDDKGCSPVLGNNLFVGAGGKIIGALTVGDNVKVGANAVVVKSVDSNLTVVGIPARPI
jgi:serine O-acetyltransferase